MHTVSSEDDFIVEETREQLNVSSEDYPYRFSSTPKHTHPDLDEAIEETQTNDPPPQPSQTQRVPQLDSSALNLLMGKSDQDKTNHSKYQQNLLQILRDEEHVSSSDSNSEPNITPSDQGGVIDETPIRPREQETIKLLCYWISDKKWWPCIARRHDWDAKNPKSIVQFRQDESGEVDLNDPTHVKQFDLKRGDTVHYMENSSSKASKRCQILETMQKTDDPNELSTTDGVCKFKVKLDSGRQIIVKVADLNFTYRDMKLWNDSRELTPSTAVSPVKRRSPIQSNNVTPTKPDFSYTRSMSMQVSNKTAFGLFPEAKRRRGLRLFEGCTFSLSMTIGRERIQRLIESHGGVVLERGLSDLIQLQIEKVNTDSCSFGFPSVGVRTMFEPSNFICVLADQPRRTIKYLEMVSLGWPCLSTGYVHDCIEGGELYDWQPYLLPTGKSELPIEREVSADCSQFRKHWLMSASLEEQFKFRRVLLRPASPIYVVCSSSVDKSRNSRFTDEDFSDDSKHDTYTNEEEERLLLMMALTVPFNTIRLVNKLDMVPGGGLVVLLNTQNNEKCETVTDPLVKYDLHNYASIPFTLVKNKDWLVQCIINGKFI